MPELAQQRCLNHGHREAAARCPECKNFFCRECIAEHEDRVICASCLNQLLEEHGPRRRGFARLIRVGQGVLGLVLAWLFFYALGEQLLKLPSSFHEGTLWKTRWFDQ